MKADPQQQRLLLEVADVDVAIAQVRHRKRSMPEAETLKEVSAKLDQASQALVAADTQVSDLTNDQARAEADLVPVRQRRERNQTTVDAGAGDPKALAAMVHEISSLDKRISDLEDAELEVMEALETATARRDRIATIREKLAAQQTEAKQAVDTVTTQLDQELAQRTQRRTALASNVAEPLLTLYTRIAERQGGMGAAALDGGRCTGCRLEANPADLSRYRAAAPDDVLRCEECGRILVRP